MKQQEQKQPRKSKEVTEANTFVEPLCVDLSVKLYDEI